MKLKLIVVLVAILSTIYLLKDIGFYRSACTCSYTFRLTKPGVDCAMFCAQYKPLAPQQEIINKILGK